MQNNIYILKIKFTLILCSLWIISFAQNSPSKLYFTDKKVSASVNDFVSISKTAFASGDTVTALCNLNRNIKQIFTDAKLNPLVDETVKVKMFVDGKFASDHNIRLKSEQNKINLSLFHSKSFPEFSKWMEDMIYSRGKGAYVVKLYFQPLSPEGKGLDMLAEGEFTIMVLGSTLDKIKEDSKTLFDITLTKLDKTNDDTEFSWTIVAKEAKGYLRTKQAKRIETWEYNIGNNSGVITQVNDEREWKVECKDGSIIKIRSKGLKDPTMWTISDGLFTIKVATRYGPNFDEWVIVDDENKPILMRLIYKDDYNFWFLKDDMPKEDVHMKIASMFICFVMGKYYGQI